MPGLPAKETVIVVHGTFSGTAPGAAPGWYAPDQTFDRQLGQALEARGSTARCWRHLQRGEDYFHWNGANDWLSRSKATARLRQELRRLCAQGWTVHLVGHSHGGNVIIDAITDDLGRIEPWFSGRVALLGTPIYRDSAAFSNRLASLSTRWSVASLVAWTVVLYLSARHVDVPAAFALGSPTQYWALVVGVILGTAAAVLLFRGVQSFISRNRFRYLWLLKLLPLSASAPDGGLRWSPAFVLINSRFDEAYRSLSGLPQGANPLIGAGARAKGGFTSNLRVVVESGRSSLSALIANTLGTHHVGALTTIGVTSILVALLWQTALSTLSPAPLSIPGTSLVFWMVVTTIAVTACFFDRFVVFPGIVLTEGLSALWRGLVGFMALSFDGRIKDAVWGFIASLSLGLNGAPQRVADISVSLRFEALAPEDCVYLELPREVVSGIIEAQKGRLSEIQEILYRKAATWSPTALREELESVDFPLVHTAYYRDPECIQKMADWMCEPIVQEFDGRSKVQTTRPQGQSVRRAPECAPGGVRRTK